MSNATPPEAPAELCRIRLSSGTRKKLYVSPQTQGRILAAVAFYWCGYHVLLWHVMFLYRYLQYRGELLAGAPPVPFRELYGTFALQNYSVIVCAVAILPIVAWEVLQVSHRLVGPLVRFSAALKQMAQGLPGEEIKIRKHDCAGQLEAAYNDFIRSPYSPKGRRAAEPNSAEPVPVAVRAELAAAAEPAVVTAPAIRSEVVTLPQPAVAPPDFDSAVTDEMLTFDETSHADPASAILTEHPADGPRPVAETERALALLERLADELPSREAVAPSPAPADATLASASGDAPPILAQPDGAERVDVPGALTPGQLLDELAQMQAELRRMSAPVPEQKTTDSR